MKGYALVKARLRQPDKVPYSLGRKLWIQLDGEVAQVGFYSGITCRLDALRLEHVLFIREESPLATRFRR